MSDSTRRPDAGGDARAYPEAQTKVGQELKRLREAAGLSLRAFAQVVGFSASFISQVENGVASPSIASLGKMASALNVTIPDLFVGGTTREPLLVRAMARPTFRSEWSKARIDSLVPLDRSVKLEALLVTIEPGGSSGKSRSTVNLDQFTMVIEGRIVLHHGCDEIQLERGDSILIRARTPHRWVNAGATLAEVLVVTTRSR
jgi:transcriptional regulator with XRE-family HTH domain